MEKRSKAVTLSQFLGRYFLVTSGLISIVVLSVYVLFTLGLQFHLITPANSAQLEAEQFIQEIKNQGYFDSSEVPESLDYVLFEREQIIAQSLDAQQELPGYSLFSRDYFGTFGRYYWYRTDLSTQRVVLLFQYQIRPTNPQLASWMPDIQQPMLISVVILILICLGLTTRHYGRQLSVSLSALEEAATQIAAGNLDFSVRSTHLSDFNHALDSVDTMRSALKDSLIHQWDMQNQREIQIAALAHDLKTPLTVIQGNVELLKEDEPLSPEGRESIETIRRRLDDLKTYVMQLQRAAVSQTEQEQSQAVAVDQLIQRCAQDIRLLCESKNIQMKVFSAPFKAKIHAETIRRALINLLDNAIRYCPEERAIQLMAQIEEHRWIIKVSDEGPGFTAESLTHIGEPFYRYESARSSNGHAGLGLYTVSQAMQIEGGQMIPGNVPDGSGAQIILEFPLSSLIQDQEQKETGF